MPINKYYITVDGKEHQVSKDNIDQYGMKAYADAYKGATIRMKDDEGDYDVPLDQYNSAINNGLHPFLLSSYKEGEKPQEKDKNVHGIQNVQDSYKQTIPQTNINETPFQTRTNYVEKDAPVAPSTKPLDEPLPTFKAIEDRDYDETRPTPIEPRDVHNVRVRKEMNSEIQQMLKENKEWAKKEFKSVKPEIDRLIEKARQTANQNVENINTAMRGAPTYAQPGIGMMQAVQYGKDTDYQKVISAIQSKYDPFDDKTGDLMHEVYDYLVKRETPESAIEYIVKNAFGGSITGGILSLGAKKSQTQQKIEQVANEQYDANWFEKGVAGAGSILLDAPAFGLTGIVGRKAAGATMKAITNNVVGKMMAEGATKEAAAQAATRLIQSNIPKYVAARVGAGALSSGVTFAGYDIANDMIRQGLSNEKYNPLETVQAGAEGLVKGAAFGAFGAETNHLMRNLTGVAKTAAQVGSFTGEVGLFTGMGVGSQLVHDKKWEDIDLGEEVLVNAATVLALKAAHPGEFFNTAKKDANGRMIDNIAFTENQKEEIRKAGYNPDKMENLIGKFSDKPTKNAEITDDAGNTYMNEIENRFISDDYANIMNNPNISMGLKSKLLYLVEGKVTSRPPLVTDSRVDGSNVTTLDAGGRTIDVTTFSSPEKAQEYANNLKPKAEMNKVLVAEEMNDRVVDDMYNSQAIEDYAIRNDMTIEEVATVISKKASGERLTEAENAIIDGVNNEKSDNKSYKDNISDGIAEKISNETGVPVYEALLKKDNERTQEERNAISRYTEELLSRIPVDGKMNWQAASPEMLKGLEQRSYDKGAGAEDPQDKHDFKKNVDIARQSMLDKYGPEFFKTAESYLKLDANQIVNGMRYEGFSSDQISDVLDLYNKQQSLKGAYDAAEKKADDVLNKVNEETRANANLYNNRITKVTALSPRGLMQGHIIAGNLVFSEDGAIDKANSEDILYFKGEDGKIYPVSPDNIKEVISDNALDDVLKENERAKLDELKKGTDSIDYFPDIPAPVSGGVFISDGISYTILDVAPDGSMTIIDTELLNSVGKNDEKAQQVISENAIDMAHDEYMQAMTVAADTNNGGNTQPAEDGTKPAGGVTELEAQPATQPVEPITPADAAPASEEVVTTPQEKPSQAETSPLPSIPVDDKGNVLYHTVPVERTIANLQDGTLTDHEVDEMVAANVKETETAVNKIANKPPKIGTNKAKFIEDKAKWQTSLDEAKSRLNYWSTVQRTIAENKLNAAQETTDTAPVAVTPVERWNAAEKVIGSNDEIVLPNNEKIKGFYTLVNADAPIPSHDALNGFSKSAGFPVDENGKTVNDRDYEKDKEAQEHTKNIANSYDSRAVQNPVVVSKDGFVLSGNGRTMASQLAAQQGTDKAYNDYLLSHADKYGFTEEQVSAMPNPRVVFVPDADMPYNAATFAKFNSEDKKTQSKTEQAVKLGKTIDDGTFNRIAAIIDGFDTLPLYYGSSSAATDTVKELVAAGVIGENERAEMLDGDLLSAVGKDMIENLLLGKTLQDNDDAVRMLSEYRDIRQAFVKAMTAIVANKKLGKDYSLVNYLSKAVNLVYDARKAGYKSTDMVSAYAAQTTMFGESPATKYADAKIKMLADIINKGGNKLKNVLDLYNSKAINAANGQDDMFSGIEDRETILNNVLNGKGTINDGRSTISVPASGSNTGSGTTGTAGGGTAKTGVTLLTADELAKISEDSKGKTIKALKEAIGTNIPNVKAIEKGLQALQKQIKALENGISTAKNNEEVNKANTILYTLYGQEEAYRDILKEIKDKIAATEKADTEKADTTKVNETKEPEAPKAPEEKKYTVQKRYNQKTGEDIYAVNFKERVDRETFLGLKSKVKEFGGYYSSFGKGGFIFDNEQDAKDFGDSITGADKSSSIKTGSEQLNFKDIALSIKGVTMFEEDEDGITIGSLQTHTKYYFEDYDKDDRQLNDDKKGLAALEKDHEDNVLLAGSDKVENRDAYAKKHGLDMQGRSSIDWNKERKAAKEYLKEESIYRDVVIPYFENRKKATKDNGNSNTDNTELDEPKKITESNGYKVGDKVIYNGKEATIYDFEDDGRPVLDTGNAPVMYEVAEWDRISKPENSAKPKTDTPKQKATTIKDNDVYYNSSTDGFVHIIQVEGGKVNAGFCLADGTLMGIREQSVSDFEKGVANGKYVKVKKTSKQKKDESLNDYYQRLAIDVQNMDNVQDDDVESTPKSKSSLVADEDQDEFAALRKRLRAKLNNLNSGPDPEFLEIGAKMSYLIIKNGIRKFVDYAKGMIDEVGEDIKPYLKQFYLAAQADERLTDEMFNDMDNAKYVRDFDLISMGKKNVSIFDTIDGIAKEHEVEIDVDKINSEKKFRPATEEDIESRKQLYYKGKAVYIIAVMHSGEQIGPASFSKPKIDRIILTDGSDPKLEELSVEDKTVSKENKPKDSNSNGNGVSSRKKSNNDKIKENELRGNDEVRTGGLQADDNNEGKHPEGLGKEKQKKSEGNDGQGKGTGSEGVHGNLSDGLRHDDVLKEGRNVNNNHVERGRDYAPRSVDARIEANIKAIELMQSLIESGSKATPEQMAVLRKYSGWGGLGKAFTDKEISDKLGFILSAEAYEQANMSRNSAYYTPADIIDSLWDIVKALGFKGGNILEGSAGIGNILGLMPTEFSNNSDIHAVEIDNTSGNILSLLYPDSKVDIQGFEKTFVLNGSVDLAITNVPFVTGLRVADTSGDSDLSKKFHDIHDFCIAKNIRKLKEGGIGVFITSSGTLDNSKKLREWIVKEGLSDVVGVFRLNNKTFGGTGATSDIIVVKKRINGFKSNNAIDVTNTSSERTATFKTDETKKVGGINMPVTRELSMDYNQYFINHPEMMGGVMKFGFEEGDTFRPTSKALYPVSGELQVSRLKKFCDSFKSMKEEKEAAKEKTEFVETFYEALGSDIKEGNLFIDNNDRICIAQLGRAIPLSVNNNKVKGHTKVECFKAYSNIKDVLKKVLDYQINNDTDKGLKPLIEQLNKAYDDFVKTYGYFNKNVSISFLKNDVDYSNVLALETFSQVEDISGKKKQIFGKTDIFNKRVVDKEKEQTFSNVKDGIISSVYNYGRIDIPYISEHLNRSEEDIKNEIISKGLGFENPNTRQMEVSYEYLSGNVREKLKQAKDNNQDGKYNANIKALEKVIPMNIPAHLIEFTLGSSWVDSRLYSDYIKQKTNVQSKLTNAGGTWLMSMDESGAYNDKNISFGVKSEILNTIVLGTSLIEAALQNKSITVSKTHKRYDGTSETITDKDATKACSDRIDEIRQEFKEWARQKMQTDPELSAKIESTYNELYNNYVPRNIPDEYLPEHFGGASNKITLRKHQSKAVVRGTMQPLILAHEVGTGKTFTLISTAMEMRRLGTANKPMIVVQNATVGQFVSSAKELYPNAKVLTIEDADRSVDGRKNFYAKIKYNDWDMIVVPQSVFERIPDSEQRQYNFVKDKIEEKLYVLEQLKEDDPDGKSMIVRQAEGEIDSLSDELANLSSIIVDKKKTIDEKKAAIAKQNAAVKAVEMLDRSVDDVENFDDMGIDAILVDEAHEYKHLGFATAMQRGVKGIDPSYSKKAQGVFLKSQAVLEKNNGRNVIFATGTPISNTAAEIWTFMRYLMPKETMQEYGIYYFDDFVRNFGNLQQMLEFTTSGKFNENNRFAGYVNTPELVRLWSGIADTVLTREAGGVSDKIPDIEGGKAQDIYLPQTKALRSVMKYVKAQLDDYEQMTGKEKKQNSHIPLTMYGIAKAAAVDARLVVSDAEDDPNSKTNEVVRQTLKSLEETKEYNGTVAIFADNYQNKESGFNLYEDIRQKLIDKGVPPEKVVAMKPGMTVKKKLEIFDKFNRGDIRVIMGSTATLGTGVNIQERLHTLIHVDAPNRQMDYTQRIGRILRQGNLHKLWNKPVRILRFGVEDSLDITAYQRLKTKGAIADSIMNGKEMMQDSMENRSLDEEEDLFGDTIAQLSGSEYGMLKNQAEKDERKYSAKLKQWEADQIYIHNQKPKLQGYIKAADETISENNKKLNTINAISGKPAIKVGNKSFDNVESMGEYIKDFNKKIKEAEDFIRNSPLKEDQERKLTINIGGIDFVVKTVMSRETEKKGGTLVSVVKRVMTYSCAELNLEDQPVKQMLLRNALEDITENVITGNDFKERIDAAEQRKERYQKDLQQILEREGKPFQYAEELEKSRKRVEEYSDLMEKEMAEKEAKYAEMDAEVKEADNIVSVSDDDSTDNSSDNVRFRDSEGTTSTTDNLVTAANDFAESLHTPINIVTDVNQITDDNKSAEFRKRKSKGYYDPKTGEIVIVIPNATSEADLQETCLHEIVAHKGLREMVGEANFISLCDKVYNSLPEKVQKKWYDKYRSKGKAYDDLYTKRAAADEYMASIAEEGCEASLWQRIKNFIKDLFRKLGIKLKISDNDIKVMLWKSKNRLKEGDGPIDVTNKIAKERKLKERVRKYTEEELNIIDDAKAKGTYLKDNGKPTLLNKKQWAEVRTKAFKEYFGDWENDPENASKVVDRNGAPLVVFHGTPEQFNAFKNNSLSWFSPVSKYAKNYSHGGNMMDCYLNIRNIADIGDTTQGIWYSPVFVKKLLGRIKVDEDKLKSIFNKYKKETYVWNVIVKPEFIELLKNSGYEGIKAIEFNNDAFAAFRPDQVKSSTENNGDFDPDNNDIRYREVTDQETLDKLNSEPTIKVYRAMQLVDGKLYPPMSGKVNGEWRTPIELGKWEEAEENPELADSNSKFKLDKGNKKSIKAAYNPYIHTSRTPLNDQFSEAQNRPELVTVEVEIPVSELTSEYKAEKAKDAVGEKEWKAGVVQGKLSGKRKVILSRWDRPLKIVDESKVADEIIKMFDGKDITMPSNVVTPALRAELEKRGVPFVETNNQGKVISSDIRFRDAEDNPRPKKEKGESFSDYSKRLKEWKDREKIKDGTIMDDTEYVKVMAKMMGVTPEEFIKSMNKADKDEFKRKREEEARINKIIRDAELEEGGAAVYLARKQATIGLNHEEKIAFQRVANDIALDTSKDGLRRAWRDQVIERRRFLESSNLETSFLVNDIKKETTKAERNAIPFIIEGTYTEPVSDKLYDVVIKIQDWFDEMYDDLDREGVAYSSQKLNNYVTHIWDDKRSDKDALVSYNNMLKMRSPYTKKRVISTLAEGINMGLVPKYDDITDVMQEYGQVANLTIANKRLVDFMKSLTIHVDDPIPAYMPLMIKSNQNDSDYTLIDNDTLTGYKVHKSMAHRIKTIFGEGADWRRKGKDELMWDDKVWRLYDRTGSFAKRVTLSLSFFHAGALSESAIASLNPIGFTKTLLKDMVWDSLIHGQLPTMVDRKTCMDAVSHMVQLGASSDYDAKDVGSLTGRLAKWAEDYTKAHPNIGAKSIKYLTEFVDGVNTGMDKFLWNWLHDSLKMYTYKKYAAEWRQKCESKGYNSDTVEKGLNNIGQMVNDQFGGQHWELLNITPKQLLSYKRILLSPDWNISSVRQFLGLSGRMGYYDGKDFKDFNVKEGSDPTRKFQSIRSSIFWITAMTFFGGFTNLINSLLRKKDEDSEKMKAEEIRKIHPDYKSPYEVKYPDGMKWYDYTMYGNTIGKVTDLFVGRSKDNTELYARWGKQFREVPELLYGNKGFDIPQNIIDKLLGKANPNFNLIFTLINGKTTSGYAPEELRNDEKKNPFSKWIGRTTFVAKNNFIPWSVSDFIAPDNGKDWKAISLVMPTSKGYTTYKAKTLMEDGLKTGNIEMVKEAYNSAAMNGLDADKLINAAISSFEATVKTEYSDGLNTIQEAVNAFDNAADTTKKNIVRTKLKKMLAESEYTIYDKDESFDKAMSIINGESKDGIFVVYDELEKSDDVRQDYEIRRIMKQCEPVMDKWKESNYDKTFYESNKTIIDLYRIGNKTKSGVDRLKKAMDLKKDNGLIGNIRKMRTDYIDTARKVYKDID